MDDDSKTAVQRQTRWLKLFFILLCLGVIGMSLWIRLGHPVTTPLALWITGLLLFSSIVARIVTRERSRIDPDFAARTMADSSLYQRFLHWRGTLSGVALAAVLLMFAFFKLAQAVPAIATALHQEFGPLTLKELLLGSFAFFFALVWGVVALYDRYSKAQR
jgi:hypothetical protein